MTFILLLASLICALVGVTLGFGWIGTDPFEIDTWAAWISLSAVFYVAACILGAGIPDLGDLPRRRRSE